MGQTSDTGKVTNESKLKIMPYMYYQLTALVNLHQIY
jgi:hypothetical protein